MNSDDDWLDKYALSWMSENSFKTPDNTEYKSSQNRSLSPVSSLSREKHNREIIAEAKTCSEVAVEIELPPKILIRTDLNISTNSKPMGTYSKYTTGEWSDKPGISINHRKREINNEDSVFRNDEVFDECNAKLAKFLNIADVKETEIPKLNLSEQIDSCIDTTPYADLIFTRDVPNVIISPRSTKRTTSYTTKKSRGGQFASAISKKHCEETAGLAGMELPQISGTDLVKLYLQFGMSKSQTPVLTNTSHRISNSSSFSATQSLSTCHYSCIVEKELGVRTSPRDRITTENADDFKDTKMGMNTMNIQSEENKQSGTHSTKSRKYLSDIRPTSTVISETVNHQQNTGVTTLNDLKSPVQPVYLYKARMSNTLAEVESGYNSSFLSLSSGGTTITKAPFNDLQRCTPCEDEADHWSIPEQCVLRRILQGNHIDKANNVNIDHGSTSQADNIAFVVIDKEGRGLNSDLVDIAFDTDVDKDDLIPKANTLEKINVDTTVEDVTRFQDDNVDRVLKSESFRTEVDTKRNKGYNCNIAADDDGNVFTVRVVDTSNVQDGSTPNGNIDNNDHGLKGKEPPNRIVCYNYKGMTDYVEESITPVEKTMQIDTVAKEVNDEPVMIVKCSKPKSDMDGLKNTEVTQRKTAINTYTRITETLDSIEDGGSTIGTVGEDLVGYPCENSLSTPSSEPIDLMLNLRDVESSNLTTSPRQPCPSIEIPFSRHNDVKTLREDIEGNLDHLSLSARTIILEHRVSQSPQIGVTATASNISDDNCKLTPTKLITNIYPYNQNVMEHSIANDQDDCQIQSRCTSTFEHDADSPSALNRIRTGIQPNNIITGTDNIEYSTYTPFKENITETNTVKTPKQPEMSTRIHEPDSISMPTKRASKNKIISGSTNDLTSLFPYNQIGEESCADGEEEQPIDFQNARTTHLVGNDKPDTVENNVNVANDGGLWESRTETVSVEMSKKQSITKQSSQPYCQTKPIPNERQETDQTAQTTKKSGSESCPDRSDIFESTSGGFRMERVRITQNLTSGDVAEARTRLHHVARRLMSLAVDPYIAELDMIVFERQIRKRKEEQGQKQQNVNSKPYSRSNSTQRNVYKDRGRTHVPTDTRIRRPSNEDTELNKVTQQVCSSVINAAEREEDWNVYLRKWKQSHKQPHPCRSRELKTVSRVSCSAAIEDDSRDENYKLSMRSDKEDRLRSTKQLSRVQSKVSNNNVYVTKYIDNENKQKLSTPKSADNAESSVYKIFIDRSVSTSYEEHDRVLPNRNPKENMSKTMIVVPDEISFNNSTKFTKNKTFGYHTTVPETSSITDSVQNKKTMTRGSKSCSANKEDTYLTFINQTIHNTCMTCDVDFPSCGYDDHKFKTYEVPMNETQKPEYSCQQKPTATLGDNENTPHHELSCSTNTKDDRSITCCQTVAQATNSGGANESPTTELKIKPKINIYLKGGRIRVSEENGESSSLDFEFSPRCLLNHLRKSESNPPQQAIDDINKYFQMNYMPSLQEISSQSDLKYENIHEMMHHSTQISCSLCRS